MLHCYMQHTNAYIFYLAYQYTFAVRMNVPPLKAAHECSFSNTMTHSPNIVRYLWSRLSIEMAPPTQERIHAPALQGLLTVSSCIFSPPGDRSQGSDN